MIDVGVLATGLGGILAPALPYLLKGAGSGADEAARKLGPEAFNLAQRLWAKLGPKVESSPAAHDAAQRAASKPEDTRVRGALELQIEALLDDDKALAGELARLLESSSPRGAVNVQVSGERAVGIAGNVSGTTINTRDTRPSSASS